MNRLESAGIEFRVQAQDIVEVDSGGRDVVAPEWGPSLPLGLEGFVERLMHAQGHTPRSPVKLLGRAYRRSRLRSCNRSNA